MNKLFSFKLYLMGLKRVQNMGIATAIIIIVSGILPPLYQIDEPVFDYAITAEAIVPAGSFIILIAPLMAYRMFSFLNKRHSADFYHTIPQKRICVYLSFMAAALTWLLGTLAVGMSVGTLLWSVFAERRIAFDTVLDFMLNHYTAIIYMVGCTAVGTMVTGTAFTAGFTAIALMTFPILILSNLVSVAEEYAPAAVFSPWITGEKHILSKLMSADPAPDLSLLINFIAGVGLIAHGAWLYVKRQSETAGKSASSKKVQFILRVTAGLPLTILAVFAAMAFEAGVFSLLIMAIISFALFELVSTKNAKKMVSALPSYVVVIIVAFAIWCAGLGLGNLAVASYPDSADDLRSVTFEDTAVEVQLEGFNVSFYGPTSNSLVLNTVVKAIHDHDDPYFGELISVETAMGRRKEYRVNLNEAAVGETLSQLAKVDKTVFAELISLPDEGMIREDDLSLWRVFVKEYEELTEEEKLSVLDTSKKYNSPNSIFFKFNMNNGYSITYYIHKNLLPKTFEAAKTFRSN